MLLFVVVSEQFDSPSKRSKHFSNLLLYWGGSAGVVPNINKTETLKSMTCLKNATLPAGSGIDTLTETQLQIKSVEKDKAAIFKTSNFELDQKFGADGIVSDMPESF